MSDFPFNSVVLRSQPPVRSLMTAIASDLRQRYGCEIHAYCNTPEDVRVFRALNGDGIFASITIEQGPHRLAREPAADRSTTLERALHWESEIGITMNQMAMTNRHLGRSYSLGGFHHPRSSYSEGTDYWQVLSAYVRALDFWQDEIDRKGLDFVFNPTVECAVVARSRNIPIRSLFRSRYRNYHYWAVNELYESPAFEQAFNALATRQGQDLADLGEYSTYTKSAEERRKIRKELNLPRTLRDMAHITAKQVYGRLRGYDKADGYYLRERLRYRYRQWSDLRRLAKLPTTPLDNLEGQRFVFYPLHEEPETAITIGSPEYFNQLQAISVLARDLPAGVKLAVKDAVNSLGRRPDAYYQQICEFKNVIWLDINEPGIEVIRRAEAVATIAGTAGIEGAILGKPVISFGRHNLFNFLPHAYVIEREDDLRDYLSHALSPTFDRNTAVLHGRMFMQAIVDASFDMGSYSYVGDQDVDPDHAALACRALIDCVPLTHTVADTVSGAPQTRAPSSD